MPTNLDNAAEIKLITRAVYGRLLMDKMDKNAALESFDKQMENDRAIWATRDESCLSKWYPVVKDLVPTPRTEIIHTDVNFIEWFDQKVPAGLSDFYVDFRRAVERIGSMPVFIRTGHTSAKHEWIDTCFLQSIDDLEKHVERIVCFSACADFMGLATSVWVAREFLPTVPPFTAFDDFPVTKERRYFVRDGQVVCHHPYWPKEELEVSWAKPSVENWRDLLAEINHEDEIEIAELTALSEKVSTALPGYWSVDWLWTERGWYLTDMASGVGSYHWQGCEKR